MHKHEDLVLECVTSLRVFKRIFEAFCAMCLMCTHMAPVFGSQEKLAGVTFLQLHWSWGSNTGLWTWWSAPLLAKTSHILKNLSKLDLCARACVEYSWYILHVY